MRTLVLTAYAVGFGGATLEGQKGAAPVKQEGCEQLVERGDRLREEGRPADAEPVLRNAVELCSRFDISDPRLALSWNSLAIVLEVRGRYEDAEAMFRRAVSVWEQPGGDRKNLAIGLRNLANLLRIKGDYADAELLYPRVMRMDDPAPGSETPDFAETLLGLGTLQIHTTVARPREAERLLERALKLWSDGLGPDHPISASALNNLGTLYASEGRLVDAETLLGKALKIQLPIIISLSDAGFRSRFAHLCSNDSPERGRKRSQQ